MDILLPRFNWPCTSLPWRKHLEQSLKVNNPRANFFKFRHESIALAHFYNNLTDQKSKQFPAHGKRRPLCETAILQDTQFARLRRGATTTMLSAPPSHHPALQSHNWSKWLSLETLTKGASQWILDLRTFSAHELSCPLVDMFWNDLFSPKHAACKSATSIRKTISSSTHSYRKYTSMPRQFRFIDSIWLNTNYCLSNWQSRTTWTKASDLQDSTSNSQAQYSRPHLGQVTIFQSRGKSPVRGTDLQHACTVAVLQRCQGMIRSEDLLTPSDHLAALKSAVDAVNAPSAVVSATAVFANFGTFLQKPKGITMNLSKSAAPWAPGCLYFQPRQQNRKRSLVQRSELGDGVWQY